MNVIRRFFCTFASCKLWIMEECYNITKEDILLLPSGSYGGEIKIIDTECELREALPILRSEGIVGFDTETKPVFTKGVHHDVAIIQLATAKCVFLIRLKKLGFPVELANILSDKSILKIGMGILQDMKGLKKLRKFTPDGFVDLATMTAKMGYKCEGVKKLSALILGVQISKRQQVSNWEAEELSEAQIIYAATDAWVCREMYLRLINKKD